MMSNESEQASTATGRADGAVHASYPGTSRTNAGRAPRPDETMRRAVQRAAEAQRRLKRNWSGSTTRTGRLA